MTESPGAGYTVDDSPETVARNRHDFGNCGPDCALCVSERSDRTPEDEQAVVWRYYLDMGIAMLKQPKNDEARTALVHSGYYDPVDVLTELASALLRADISRGDEPTLNIPLGPEVSL